MIIQDYLPKIFHSCSKNFSFYFRNFFRNNKILISKVSTIYFTFMKVFKSKIFISLIIEVLVVVAEFQGQ